MNTICIYCDGTGTTPQIDDPNECGFCTGGRADHNQAAAAMAGVRTVVERLTDPRPTHAKEKQ